MTLELYNYKGLVTRVIDGDTAVIKLDLGHYVELERSCRLGGINSPELNSPDPEVRTQAQKSRDFLAQLITGQAVWVHSEKLDKYGRPIVTIYLDAGTNVNQLMIDDGYAVPYMV